MLTEDEMWQAVAGNRIDFDGTFYYAVRTTGIFCKPSCTSRMPDRANTTFFVTIDEAVQAGFRACKRCRPDLPSYRPLEDLAAKARCLIERHAGDRQLLARELASLGISQRRLDQVFRQIYGSSAARYTSQVRMQQARDMLADPGRSATDVALSSGFESLSAFLACFRQHCGGTPREYRRLATGYNAQSDTCGYVYDTAMGSLAISGNGASVVSVQFGDTLRTGVKPERTNLLDRASAQLDEYFAGLRTCFDLPVDPVGTLFQKAVWQAICAIPYGATRTYQEVAHAIGRPSASRAVGMACNRNPLLLIIPCHRVVGVGGKLVGYAGGIETKRQLLAMEKQPKERPSDDTDIL